MFVRWPKFFQSVSGNVIKTKYFPRSKRSLKLFVGTNRMQFWKSRNSIARRPKNSGVQLCHNGFANFFGQCPRGWKPERTFSKKVNPEVFQWTRRMQFWQPCQKVSDRKALKNSKFVILQNSQKIMSVKSNFSSKKFYGHAKNSFDRPAGKLCQKAGNIRSLSENDKTNFILIY